MRMVQASASLEAIICPYHGWRWGKDGVLQFAQDGHDFPQGDPCGKLSLRELRCDTWGGFVWYTMDDAAEPLLDYLEPMPALYRNYPMDKAVRVAWYRIAINANWKFVSDNFSESYHTRTAHPQVPPWIDQDVDTARHEMWPRGHGRTVQPMRPSLSDRLPGRHRASFRRDPAAVGYRPGQLCHLRGFRPARLARSQGRQAQAVAGARLSPLRAHGRGGDHRQPAHGDLPERDDQLPAGQPDLLSQRTAPDDPEKCFFDLWCMAFPVEGQETCQSIMAGEKPLREVAACEHRDFDGGRGVPELAGQIVYAGHGTGRGDAGRNAFARVRGCLSARAGNPRALLP
jgi:hypothetical protein